jgi:hypothetical protein
MKYLVTLTVEVSLSGGASDDVSGFVAKTLKRRLSAGHGGRYAFPGEVVANTLERVLEDEIGDGHTVVSVNLSSLATEARRVP